MRALTDRARRAAEQGWRTRRAVAADADDLAAVHVRVWLDTYTGLMRPEALASLDVGRSAERWRGFLEDPDSRGREPWVGLDPQGELVAMASSGPARDDDAPTAWELRALNVLPRAHGSGLADLLMADLVGDDAAYLWVVEGNARAIAFYTRHGFTADGSRWDEEYGVTEVRMNRPTR